nr:unnamed protein product [uncultured bacterium]
MLAVKYIVTSKLYSVDESFDQINRININFSVIPPRTYKHGIREKESTWYSRLLIPLLNSDSDIAKMLLFNVIYLDQWEKMLIFLLIPVQCIVHSANSSSLKGEI